MSPDIVMNGMGGAAIEAIIAAAAFLMSIALSVSVTLLAIYGILLALGER